MVDGALGPTKPCPRKERKTPVDGRRVQGINGGVSFDTQVVVDIEWFRPGDKNVSDIGIDTPVPVLVGVGTCAPGDTSADPHVVKF